MLEGFEHIGRSKGIAQFSVIFPCANAGHYCNFCFVIFLKRNFLGFLQERFSKALVLIGAWFFLPKPEKLAMNVKLPYKRGALS